MKSYPFLFPVFKTVNMHAVRWVIQSWMLCTICEWFCMNMLLSQSPKSDCFVQSILGYFQNRMWPFWMILNMLFKVIGWVYHLNWNGSKYGLKFFQKVDISHFWMILSMCCIFTTHFFFKCSCRQVDNVFVPHHMCTHRGSLVPQLPSPGNETTWKVYW